MSHQTGKIKWFTVPILVTGALVLTACSNNNQTMDHQGHDMKNMSVADAPYEVLTGNSFTLTAKESMLHLDDQTMKTVWTFNGTVPGPQIRVKQGETVKIILNNELKEPTTIHWHGLPVPNNMDGIPGHTQNAVKPGESFTYEFKANVPGTYWYHSHQNGVVQVDKGMYGSLVVEGKDEKAVDIDTTLVLDEWTKDDGMAGMNHGSSSSQAPSQSSSHSGGHGGHGSMPGMEGMSDAEMMAMMYPVFSVNGKTGSAIQPVQVKEGQRVRIRLVNAGFLPHKLHLQGHEFQVVSTDGQSIHNPASVKDQLLSVAPGERYDIEFTANNPGKWLLEEISAYPGAKTLAVPINYENAKGDLSPSGARELPVLDITRYGESAKGEFTLHDSYDVEYSMDLNTDMSSGQMKFTINGKTFPDIDPVNVHKGDLVKVKMVNRSAKDLHPMHLHGHFFQVLSKNGKPITGSPLMKDTLNLLPGEEYVVAFKADNPGNWMFHCHDLGHASSGMMTEVLYDGYKPDFTVDPTVGNKPE